MVFNLPCFHSLHPWVVCRAHPPARFCAFRSVCFRFSALKYLRNCLEEILPPPKLSLCLYCASLPAEYTTWRAVPSYYGAGRGTVTAVPHETQSEPIHFTKICRPTAYRASVRNGEVQKLVKLLAAASSDNCSIQGCGSLQQSSHSAFRMLKPQQAVEA